MSFYSILPNNWIDITIQNKILFVNHKENLVSYHPPMDIKNIGAFLKLYKINISKEEVLKLLQKPTSVSSIHLKDKKPEEIKKLKLSNSLNLEQESEMLVDQNLPINIQTKPSFDKDEIKDAGQDISIIFKQAVLEKYNTLPNYEYLVEMDEKTKKSIFKCLIKIREEHRLCTGVSDFSKNDAKKDAINEGLKILVPEIYNKIISLNSDSNKNSYPSLSNSSVTITEENNHKSLLEIDIDERDNSNESSNQSSPLDYDSKFQNNFNFMNGHCFIYEGVAPKKEFLSKKRKMETTREVGPKLSKTTRNSTKTKKAKNSENNSPKNSYLSDEDVEYLYGGCLNEDFISNLAIDDPLVVDKYLKTSNFTPLSILNTFRANYPKIDVNEKIFARNDGIKFDQIKNNSYTKVVLESNKLKIRVECSHDNKKLAREFCAQKFLNKLYRGKFTKWVELVRYYEERKFVNDNYLK